MKIISAIYAIHEYTIYLELESVALFLLLKSYMGTYLPSLASPYSCKESRIVDI